MEVFNKDEQYSQNDDGEGHDKLHKSGKPPKWVRKELKRQSGWDWDEIDRKKRERELKIDVKSLPIIIPYPIVPIQEIIPFAITVFGL